MKLSLRRKHKRRLPARIQEPLQVPDQPNTIWSLDFMSDSLVDGRRIRVLNVVDDFNRESLLAQPALSFPATRLIRELERIEDTHGLPSNFRLDNGPEFISKIFQAWCESKGIKLLYIQPGKPVQNAYIERFNRIFREDILDAYWFEGLEQLKLIIQKWQHDYNHNHPHSSLGGMSPMQYLEEAVNSGKVQARIPPLNFPTINSPDNNEFQRKK